MIHFAVQGKNNKIAYDRIEKEKKEKHKRTTSLMHKHEHPHYNGKMHTLSKHITCPKSGRKALEQAITHPPHPNRQVTVTLPTRTF